MKTDSLFYQLFSQSPALLFELLGDANPRASTYGFGSQEVKQTSFRIDGILTPPPYAVDLSIYFLEVQGYRDKEGDLYPTFFGEIFLYLNDYRPSNDWKAVLIFTERRFDPGVPLHYQDFVQTGRLQRIYLDALPDELAAHSLEWGIAQLVGVKKKSAPEKARQLIGRAQRELTDVTSQQKLLELITKAIVYRFPKQSWEEIEAMLGISELRQTRAYQEAAEDGQRSLIVRQLSRRFGLSPELQAQIQGLPGAQIKELGDALLDFSSIEDLTTWLQSQRN